MKREELLRIAKPILFNTQMVRAILEGRKTCTRRLIKPKSRYACGIYIYKDQVFESTEESRMWREQKPFCRPGDVLYIRETWSTHYTAESNGKLVYCYKADGVNLKSECLSGESNRWYPSIHMPKEAARIFLRVTGVRAERLQDMNGMDILKEGVDNGKSNPAMGARWENMQGMAFKYLWNSTIDKKEQEVYGWDANPWVWVYEFERIEVEP